MTLTFTSTTVEEKTDTTPQVEGEERPADATEEAPYGYTKSGRIRKRPIGSRAGDGTGRSLNTSNERLAEQAAEALAQLNDIGATGLYVVGMTETAREISARQDAFKERAKAALVTDPGMCRTILRGGTNGGKIALIICYVMMFGSIVPTAREEFKVLRAAREEVEE